MSVMVKVRFLLPYQITACLCWPFRSYHEIRPASNMICFSRHSSFLKPFHAVPSGSRRMRYDNIGEERLRKKSVLGDSLVEQIVRRSKLH